MIRTASALCISALLGIIVFSLNAQANTFADSMADFSNVQGQGGWYYGYIDIASSPAFIPLPTYFTASQSWAIDVFMPGGTNYFTAIWAYGSHPNALVTSGNKPREHWTDRRWISDAAGDVQINGIIGDFGLGEGTFQPTDQDGVIYQVLVDGALVWSDGTNGFTANHDYSFTTSLQMGSVVDFVTKPRVSDYADGDMFTASIVDLVPEPASIALLVPALALLLGMLRLGNLAIPKGV